MPESGQKPDYQKVKDNSWDLAPVTAKRDIDIFLKPRRKRHVPSSPEISNGCGYIRIIEVLAEFETEDAA